MQVQVVSNKKVSMVHLVDACQGDVQGDPRPDEDDGQVEYGEQMTDIDGQATALGDVHHADGDVAEVPNGQVGASHDEADGDITRAVA